MLIDSHCHLDLLAKEGRNIEEIIINAKKNGVEYLQTICTSLEEFPNILQLAEKYDNVFASVGIHPNEVSSKKSSSVEELVTLSKHQKVIGLGETGLDYYYQQDDKDKQKLSFVVHIAAAQITKLPVIVHAREADDDIIEIITSEMHNHIFPGLVHCFTSSENLARKMLDLGMYISIAGIVTFKNAENLQRIVRFAPLNKLLIETDSPYLAPVPMRGKQNEPAFVKYTAEFIAGLKSIELEEVAEQTTNNFRRLFSKAKI